MVSRIPTALRPLVGSTSFCLETCGSYLRRVELFSDKSHGSLQQAFHLRSCHWVCKANSSYGPPAHRVAYKELPNWCAASEPKTCGSKTCKQNFAWGTCPKTTMHSCMVDQQRFQEVGALGRNGLCVKKTYVISCTRTLPQRQRFSSTNVQSVTLSGVPSV